MFLKYFGVFLVFVATALGVGCGDSSKKTVPAPSSPVTKALDAAFEERNADGTLIWRVTAESLVQESNVILCKKVFLKAIGSKERGGMEASASTGLIMPDQGVDSGAAVRLDGGFNIVTDDGWNVQGPSALWNGQVVTAPGALVISRPGAIMHGQNAMIDPHRNVIRMKKVHGMIEGVEL